MKRLPRPLAWIALAGLALRLGMAAHQWNAPLEWDAIAYADIAVNLAERGEFALKPGVPTANRPPVYPALLSLAAPSWNAARLAQAVLDSATIVLVFLFGLAALRDERAALGGAAFYALHPVFAAYSARILTEVVFLPAWLAAVWLTIRAVEAPRQAGLAPAALAGAAAGLAILVRPNLIFFPPGAAVMLALAHRGAPLLLRRLALALAFTGLLLVPWAVRNRLVMGAWIPVATGGGPALWCGAQVPVPDITAIQAEVESTRSELEADAEFYRMAKEDYRRNWRAVAADLPGRFVRFWVSSHSSLFGVDRPLAEYRAAGRRGPIAARAALYALHLAALGLGLFALWDMRRRWNAAGTLTLAALGYYSLHLFTGYWTARYHLPALALLVSLAGGAAVRACAAPRSATPRR